MIQENNNLMNIFSNPDGRDITHRGSAYAFGCRFCNENFKNLINERTWLIADVHDDVSWNFYNQKTWKIVYPIEFKDIHLRKYGDYGALDAANYHLFQYLWINDIDSTEEIAEHRVLHPISELLGIRNTYKQKLTNPTKHIWLRLIKPDMIVNNLRL